MPFLASSFTNPTFLPFVLPSYSYMYDINLRYSAIFTLLFLHKKPAVIQLVYFYFMQISIEIMLRKCYPVINRIFKNFFFFQEDIRYEALSGKGL